MCRRVTIEDGLNLKMATMGYLDLEEATIYGDLDLRRTKIGDIYLREATIESNLHLIGVAFFIDAIIKLDLSLRKGPKKIYVSPEMAQLVHFAAPTVPLVLVS